MQNTKKISQTIKDKRRENNGDVDPTWSYLECIQYTLLEWIELHQNEIQQKCLRADNSSMGIVSQTWDGLNEVKYENPTVYHSKSSI